MKLKSKKERREQIFAPQRLSNGRVLSLDVPQSLTLQSLTPQGLNPTRAFSVAEAMISLLIGSLILGYSAPMIAKQIKHNNMSDVQVQVLNRKIEELRRTQANVPSGAVMFFNLPTCPDGWSDISSNWNGRFPRFAGSYTSLEYDTTSKTLKTTGTAQTLSVGATQEDAIRNVSDNFNMSYRDDSTPNFVTTSSGVFNSTTTWSWGFEGSGGRASNYNLTMDLSRSVPTDVENRPRSIALLGCVKN